MVQILVFQNDKGIIEDIDNLQNLYKKCNFKKVDGFDEIYRCNYKDMEFIIRGKIKGKSNKKYVIPLPKLDIVVYGNYSVECKKDNEYINITLDIWNNYLDEKNNKNQKDNNIIDKNFNKNIDLQSIETNNSDLSIKLGKIMGEEEEVDGSYIEEKDDKFDKDEEENYDSEEEIYMNEDNVTEFDNFEEKEEMDLLEIDDLKEEELQKEMYIYSSDEEIE